VYLIDSDSYACVSFYTPGRYPKYRSDRLKGTGQTGRGVQVRQVEGYRSDKLKSIGQ